MKKLVLFCFMVLWGVCWGEAHQQESFSFHSPYVTFTFPQGFPETIYDNEVKRVLMHMRYEHLCRKKVWSNNSNGQVDVANSSGRCPAVKGDMDTWGSGDCDMVVVITGHGIGNVIHGSLRYQVFGAKDGVFFDLRFDSPKFSTTVVRRPLSMQVIEPQSATVGKDFYYPVNNAVTNYFESVQSGAPVFLMLGDGETSILNNLGLYFDASDFSIKGTPNKAGTFLFHVGVTNVVSQTEFVEMAINVQYNHEDKPRFKLNNTISSATPHEKYQLNLMDLLESTPGLNTTNQVTFHVEDHSPMASGFALSTENHLVLEGEADPRLAGKMAEFTVIASSNTGGNSEPYQLRIPVAYDRTKRPTITPFELKMHAGDQFYVDLSPYLIDPAQDPSLSIKIDQIEPKPEETDDANTFTLQVSPLNHKMLEGYIPQQAVGKKYYITLHANTHAGGDSEKIRVPLHVSIDESLTPQFKQHNPQLPLVYPGQPFAYDFVANRDIAPEYEDVPYEISFAAGYNPPKWLKLEHNKLFSESDVPPMVKKNIKVTLVITNTPGGVSKPITLSLTVP